jgi:hypothetical protein
MTPEHRLAIEIMSECGMSPHEIVADSNWKLNEQPSLVDVELVVSHCDPAKRLRSNRFLTVGGVTMTMSEWARIKGIRQSTITKRLGKGLSAEEALNRPLRITKRTRYA